MTLYDRDTILLIRHSPKTLLAKNISASLRALLREMNLYRNAKPMPPQGLRRWGRARNTNFPSPNNSCKIQKYTTAFGLIVGAPLNHQNSNSNLGFVYSVWTFSETIHNMIDLFTSRRIGIGQWICFDLRDPDLLDFDQLCSPHSWSLAAVSPIPTIPFLGRIVVECPLYLSSIQHPLDATPIQLPPIVYDADTIAPMFLRGTVFEDDDYNKNIPIVFDRRYPPLGDLIVKGNSGELRVFVLEYVPVGFWRICHIRPLDF